MEPFTCPEPLSASDLEWFVAVWVGLFLHRGFLDDSGEPLPLNHQLLLEVLLGLSFQEFLPKRDV